MALPITPEIAAEAALWVARLHGPDRDPAMEREFQRWQATSSAHREAFGRCTDVWVEVPHIKVADAYNASASTQAAKRWTARQGTTRRLLMTAGLVLAAAGGAVALQRWQEEGVYSTAVGEQRLVVLKDGTRVLLNTQTRVRVDYGDAQRRVVVDRGEALFEVAKDPQRPFIVRVAGSEVVALGTVFAVRWNEAPSAGTTLAVTLLEGKVQVRRSDQDGQGQLAPPKALTLQPGDRLELDRTTAANAGAVVAKLDRPNVEQVLAWKRQEAVFQDSLLADAVREMNRYNRTQIVLSDDLRTADLHVSGVFRTGESVNFAHAVAALHRLQVRETDGRFVLSNVR